jgi:hypothetical protein
MFNVTTSQVGRQLVVMIVCLMKRLNLITLLNNMRVYLAVEVSAITYNYVINKVFSTKEKANEYMEQTNKDYGWQVVNRIDELEVE